MIQDAKNRPISELFDIDSKVVYFIPRYQREYSWNRWHWESLFDDVIENNPGYFFGSIICINQTTDALSTQKLEIIDGQQRLVTISLLFAAVYQTLKQLEDEIDDDCKNELFNLKNKIILKRRDDQIRITPQIQNNNYNDYRAVLSEIGVIKHCDIPLYAGNRKIFRAYRYFQERIVQLSKNGNNQLETIMAFLDKISQASMVKIEVASHADAYTLFESLNNRGMPLTAIDLIKNKLLAHLDRIEPGQVDHHFEQWNLLLNFLSDDYGIQERFFRQYYNAFKDDLNIPFRIEGEKKKDPLGPLATRSNLIHIYEKLINKDAKECLQKIIKAGRQYSLFLFRNQDDALNGLIKPLKDLERIQGAPSYLLMLYLMEQKEHLKLDINHIFEIIELLVRFFVRRNLTDLPPTRDLNRLFMSIVNKIAKIEGDSVINVIRNELIAVSATDAIFQSKLEGPIYEENSGVTRFILCTLAEKGMTRETKVDLWRIENKQFIWTIEHIFPQGERIPLAWINMIADGDELKAKEYQQTHVHKLGNLTISGFNSALGNKSFEEKRDRADREGHRVGYQNGLKLNEDLAEKDKWSIEEIDVRTTKLVNMAMELFKMNGSSV